MLVIVTQPAGVQPGSTIVVRSRHPGQYTRWRTAPRRLPEASTAIPARERRQDRRRAAHTSHPTRIGRPDRTPVPCFRMESAAASPPPQPAAGFLTTHSSHRVRIFAAAASPAALPFFRTGRFRCSRASRPPRRRKSARSQETRLSAPGSARAHAGRGTPGRPPPTSCSPWEGVVTLTAIWPACGRRRRRLCNGRHLPPLSHRVAAELAECSAGDQMALDVEEVVDGRMDGEEPLRGRGRFEPLHLSLSSSHRLM